MLRSVYDQINQLIKPLFFSSIARFIMYFALYLSLWSAGLPGLFAFPQILNSRDAMAKPSGTMPSDSRGTETGTATVSGLSCPAFRNITSRSIHEISARDARPAHIGFEYETDDIKFISDHAHYSADIQDTYKLKGNKVRDQIGYDWVLTVDIHNKAGLLHAEYHVDGSSVRLEEGENTKATQATQGIVDDIVGYICYTELSLALTLAAKII